MSSITWTKYGDVNGEIQYNTPTTGSPTAIANLSAGTYVMAIKLA